MEARLSPSDKHISYEPDPFIQQFSSFLKNLLESLQQLTIDIKKEVLSNPDINNESESLLTHPNYTDIHSFILIIDDIFNSLNDLSQKHLDELLTVITSMKSNLYIRRNNEILKQMIIIKEFTKSNQGLFSLTTQLEQFILDESKQHAQENEIKVKKLKRKRSSDNLILDFLTENQSIHPEYNEEIQKALCESMDDYKSIVGKEDDEISKVFENIAWLDKENNDGKEEEDTEHRIKKRRY